MLATSEFFLAAGLALAAMDSSLFGFSVVARTAVS